MSDSSENPLYNPEQSEAALSEFGFAAVGLDEGGAPTPGRIADRLSDIHRKLDEAIEARWWPEVIDAAAELNRLLFALDSYDGFRCRNPVKSANHWQAFRAWLFGRGKR